jgi:DNA-binding transcriptional regulator YiaG
MGEETAVQELLGWLLHKLEITRRDLAAMLGVDRSTLSQWLETGYVDFGACRLVLQILEGDADSLLPLLLERVKSSPKERRPWPERAKRIRSSFNLTIADFADLLQTNPGAIVNWEQGHSEPMSCHAVILDLIEDHPDEMASILGFVPVEPGEESHEPWPKERLQAIFTKASLTSGDFARLVGIENQSVTSWMRGSSAPSACSAFFLQALEKFPQATLKLLRRTDKGAWAPGRATAAREAADLSMNELSRLTHVSARTLNGWEEEMPSRMDCPKVLYSLIERDAKAFLSFAERLRGGDEWRRG